MKRPIRRLGIVALAGLLCLAISGADASSARGDADDAAPKQSKNGAGCRTAEPVGRFHPAEDLLIANFDNKPDTDDLLAAAGLTTMLRDERLACVRYVAATGTYGNNPGSFIDATSLFNLAFGRAWADAHADRPAAVAFLAKHALKTLRRGGDVWIMEAGQSDVTAAVARRIAEKAPAVDMRSRVHLVQHSEVNEYLTTPAALAYVRDHLDYIKIANGNEVGNGTPGFKTFGGTAWPALLADPESGKVWAKARRLALEFNPTSAYPNEAIAAGGLDFSDLVEAAYVFGFEDLVDVEDFASEFAP
ncbi:hypothetical protein [Actinomadura rugatobispora]|uniref:Glucanase n=1 Tax=Actinomadura rugatobispora TaxID=1994 RepID=A0ABW0ZXC2_9ACTN|nr:hypothetical protein GCM10010200_076220 [Actinomadura rugatobispora]